MISIVTSGNQQGRWCRLECPSEPKYLRAAVANKLFLCIYFLLTWFRSRAVKPVTTPVSAYVNLLFCHFIRQEKKGSGPSWLQMRLALGPLGTGQREKGENTKRENEGWRDKEVENVSFCREATRPQDASSVVSSLSGRLPAILKSSQRLQDREEKAFSLSLSLSLFPFLPVRVAVRQDMPRSQ